MMAVEHRLALALAIVLLFLLGLSLHVRSVNKTLADDVEPADHREETTAEKVETVADKAEPDRMRIQLREIREVQQPEVSVATPKEPVAQTQPAASSATIIPSDALMASGQALMAELGDQGMPRIAADYSMHLGFSRYASAMQQLGARFAVLRRGTNRMHWIDLNSRTLAAVTDMPGMSTLTRRITGEPSLNWARQLAESGEPGAHDIVLLIPTRLEAYLAGALQDAASRDGRSLADFRSLRGAYQIERGRLVLELKSGELKSGRTVQMDVRVAL